MISHVPLTIFSKENIEDMLCKAFISPVLFVIKEMLPSRVAERHGLAALRVHLMEDYHKWQKGVWPESVTPVRHSK